MEIKYFKLIKTIAEEGSIANSADKLFLTQSALSHQLRELEERLGFKVFHRTRNRWQLTEEGHALYQTGNEVLSSIENGFESIKALKAGAAGNIRVSTECYSFYQTLPTFIQKMGLLYPEMNVDLVLEATHQPVPKMLSQEIDIALVTTKTFEERLSSVKILEDEIFMLMHKEHPLCEAPFVSADDMTDIHLIIHSFPLETVSVHTLFLAPNHIAPTKISAIPLTEVALEMVVANMGVMCMPKWALASFKIPDDIVFKRIGKHGLKRSHYLVVRTSDKKKKYIHDFISFFEEEFLLH